MATEGFDDAKEKLSVWLLSFAGPSEIPVNPTVLVVPVSIAWDATPSIVGASLTAVTVIVKVWVALWCRRRRWRCRRCR